MNLFQAIILGIVQGLTEFLPISSTAHLKIVPVALGWGDPGVTFTAVIQLGSIVAILWYFWEDLSTIVGGAYKALLAQKWRDRNFLLACWIMLGTIPIIVFGLLVKTFIPDFDSSPLRSSAAIALASIFMSLLLAWAELSSRHLRKFQSVTLRDGLFMGFAQALAIIPGVSRSGATLTAGLFTGLQRAAAARFSFLLGLPAITLAGVVELKDAVEAGPDGTSPFNLLIGTLVAVVASYVSIVWLLRYLQNRDTWIFVWYRLLFGVVILGAIGLRLLPNF
nr:undecaprenyl-diphosphate phosphatase [Petrachloros mirabilis]